MRGRAIKPAARAAVETQVSTGGNPDIEKAAEPLTGAQVVAAFPALARALARLAISGGDTPADRD